MKFRSIVVPAVFVALASAVDCAFAGVVVGVSIPAPVVAVPVGAVAPAYAVAPGYVVTPYGIVPAYAAAPAYAVPAPYPVPPVRIAVSAPIVVPQTVVVARPIYVAAPPVTTVVWHSGYGGYWAAPSRAVVVVR